MSNSFSTYLNTSLQSNSLADISFSTVTLTKSNDQKQLLIDSIKEGIKLIHFESHCFNSHAQESVGEVVNQLIYDEVLVRDSIYLCLKSGYFDSKYSKGDDFESRVDSNFIHNLNPEFLKQDITDSLIRLGLDSIDSYIIQDPDYFFNRDNVKKEAKVVQKKLFYDYLLELFVYLETEVKRGRLSSYGICFDNFVFRDDFVELFNVEEFFALLNNQISNHHFLVFECPFNLIDTHLKTQDNVGSFLAQFKTNNVFVITNRPFYTHYKNMSFHLSDYPEPEEISLLEIEDMIHAGIDLEHNLKQQLTTFEDTQSEVDYLIFFEQLSNYYDSTKGILTFQNIVNKGIYPAVEQYMNLLQGKSYLNKIHDVVDNYFSYFNFTIKSMTNYLVLLHNSDAFQLKRKLFELNPNYNPDLQLRSLALSAYRHTPYISSILLTIESYEDLDFVKTELKNNDLGVINWAYLNKDVVNA
jgi:hypothetical protein